MSYTFESAIGYDSAENRTYDGMAQEVARTSLPLELSQRLRRSNARPVFLVTCNAALPLTRLLGWLPNPGLFEFTAPPYVVAVSGVHTDNGDSLVENVDVDELGTWTFDANSKRIFVRPPNGNFDDWDSDVSSRIYFARIQFTFANHAKHFRDAFWQPRIEGLPNLSFRIDPTFGGVGQVGGGRIILNNADGYFDAKPEIVWDAGDVVLECGVDSAAGEAMDESVYQKIGTWRVDRTELSETQFILNLREIKTRMDQEIPFEVYSRDDYPLLDNEDVGKPIPIAYGKIFGAEPIVVDRGAKRFKVASHRIRSLNAVRVRQTLEEVLSKTVTNWTADPETPARFFVFEPLEVDNVQFDGTDLEAVNSISNVALTAGSWYHAGNTLYVRPPNGETIVSGAWTVWTKDTISVWQEVDFASMDLALAEFTLGDDWDRQASVSVDFSGRVMPNSHLMTNAADIMADLIDYVGEIVLDEAAFQESRRTMHVGFDRYGYEVNHLAPSIYINDKTSALDVVSELNRIAGSFAYVDFEGKWRYHVFRAFQGALFDPVPASGLRYFSEKEILSGSFRKRVNSRDVYGRIQVNYGERRVEEWHQTEVLTRGRNRFLHDVPEIDVHEQDLGLSTRNEAIYYGQRNLTTEAEPITTYEFMVPWLGFFLLPGDKIHLFYPRYAIDHILEALEVEYDLVSGRLKVTAGDQRAWNDTFGFWTADTGEVIPDVPLPVCWLDAGGTNPTTPNGTLSQWRDRSGNGNDFRNPTPGSDHPKVVPDVINGYPVIRFGGGGGGRLFAFREFMASWSEGEVFVILKSFVLATDNNLWRMGQGTTLYPSASTGHIQESFFSSSSHDTGIPILDLEEFHLYNAVSSPSEFTTNLNNSLQFTTATNTPAPAATMILGANSQGGNSFTGDIAEVLFYGRKLSSGERTAVVQYLSDKYALGLVSAAGPPPAWDPSWTDAVARYQRQNSGFWHGEDNLADSLDIRSYQASRWW